MNTGWRSVLSRILSGFVVVTITLTAAYFAAPTVSELLSLSTEQVRVFRLGSLGMVAWGTLGRSGWSIQTFSGNSSFEQFNSLWFTLLYVLGLFCGGLGLMIEPFMRIVEVPIDRDAF